MNLLVTHVPVLASLPRAVHLVPVTRWLPFMLLLMVLANAMAACGTSDGGSADITDTNVNADLDATDSSDQQDQRSDLTDSNTDGPDMQDASGDSLQDTDLDGADTVDPDALQATYLFSDPEAYPEAVTWDPVGRAFYTGSLATGTVTRISVDGQESQFFAGNTNNMDEQWLLMGVEVDPQRRRLWVCANLGRDFQRGEAWMLDLETGERLWQVDLEVAADGATCADMIIDELGNAWVADRMAGNIYQLIPESRSVNMVVSDPLLEPETVGQNGIALTPDGDLLTVKFAPLQLMHISLPENSDPLVSEVELVNDSQVSISGGGDALVYRDGHAWIVTDSQLLRVTPDGNTAEGPWSTARLLIHVLTRPNGAALTGVSGLTSAGENFYVSKSEVFKFALQLSPQLPFLLQRVKPEVFE